MNINIFLSCLSLDGGALLEYKGKGGTLYSAHSVHRRTKPLSKTRKHSLFIYKNMYLILLLCTFIPEKYTLN